MNSIPTSNYIKVRSGRSLRRQNSRSEQRIQIAGSNDVDNQPGKTVNSASLITTLTGVPQPNQVTTDVQFGETPTTKQGGMGTGSVGMPPLVPREPLSSRDLVYPFSYTHRLRQWNQLSGDSLLSDIDKPDVTNNAGSNWQQPDKTTRSGDVFIETDRTVGKDQERLGRTRNRRRRNLRNTVI